MVSVRVIVDTGSVWIRVIKGFLNLECQTIQPVGCNI